MSPLGPSRREGPLLCWGARSQVPGIHRPRSNLLHLQKWGLLHLLLPRTQHVLGLEKWLEPPGTETQDGRCRRKRGFTAHPVLSRGQPRPLSDPPNDPVPRQDAVSHSVQRTRRLREAKRCAQGHTAGNDLRPLALPVYRGMRAPSPGGVLHAPAELPVKVGVLCSHSSHWPWVATEHLKCGDRS